MSVYGIVPADLNTRLSPQRRIQLTDDETTPTGTENTTTTNGAIANAETVLHASAGIYYVTPLVATSDATAAEVSELAAMVKQMVVAIASYNLMALKPEWLQGSNENQYWFRLDKSNQAWLAGLSDPKRPTKLRAAQEVVIPTPTSGGAQVTSDMPTFTRCSMRWY